MKLTPVRERTELYYEDEDSTCLDCCDSQIAVLTPEQVDEWFDIFEKLVTAADVGEYCEFGSRTMVFEIDGKLFTVVSDSGGEYTHGEFAVFCENTGIDSQFVIDSIDCEGIEVDEIYTGGYDDNVELLTLLHRVYN